jgi:hypothetical protein
MVCTIGTSCPNARMFIRLDGLVSQAIRVGVDRAYQYRAIARDPVMYPEPE